MQLLINKINSVGLLFRFLLMKLTKVKILIKAVH